MSDLNLSIDDVVALAKKMHSTQSNFTKRAGFTPGHDRLPHFLRPEALSPCDVTFSIEGDQLDTGLNGQTESIHPRTQTASRFKSVSPF
ncbi:MAG: hypothetical protein PVG19_01735 [Desulfobacterales bacterium]|jgi:hypothetical protein